MDLISGWSSGRRPKLGWKSKPCIKLIQTLTAVCNEILFPFQHQGEVAHGYTELLDIALMVSAVHGLMVLRQQHTEKMSINTDSFNTVNYIRNMSASGD